jgi:hypothetical protein
MGQPLPQDWMKSVDQRAIRQELQTANKCMRLIKHLAQLGIREDKVSLSLVTCLFIILFAYLMIILFLN